VPSRIDPACNGSVTTPVGVLDFSQDPGSSRGVSFNVPVTSCSGSNSYAIHTSVTQTDQCEPLFPGIPCRVLGTIDTTFLTTDISTLPGVNNGVQTLTAAIAPGPALPVPGTPGTLTFTYNGFDQAIRGEFSEPVPADGFVGVYHNGQFVSWGQNFRTCAGTPLCDVQFATDSTWVQFQPNNTVLKLGDTVDLYPVAGTLVPNFPSQVTIPAQITGSRLGGGVLGL